MRTITGFSGLFSEQMPKRLGLLQELVPKAPLIGVLLNPSYSAFDVQLQQLQEAAGTLRQELHVENARTEREIGAAFEAIIQRRASAILVANDPFFFNRATQFVALAARHAIPTLYFRREFAAAGGLMKLWIGRCRAISHAWGIRRADTQGRKAGRSAGSTADEI
jgi:ABC-type uncharacterized transport system substrate-binding protein